MKPREEFEKDSRDCEPRDASFELIHNQRAIRKIEVSEGDSAFADTLWPDSQGKDFHWKGRAARSTAGWERNGK
jgi:hypothetical protein